MESCKVTPCGFSKQSCPDWLLGGGRKIAKAAKEEGLDEHRNGDGTDAGEGSETNGKKHSRKPRVGMANGDVH